MARSSAAATGLTACSRGAAANAGTVTTTASASRPATLHRPSSARSIAPAAVPVRTSTLGGQALDQTLDPAAHRLEDGARASARAQAEEQAAVRRGAASASWGRWRPGSGGRPAPR